MTSKPINVGVLSVAVFDDDNGDPDLCTPLLKGEPVSLSNHSREMIEAIVLDYAQVAAKLTNLRAAAHLAGFLHNGDYIDIEKRATPPQLN